MKDCYRINITAILYLPAAETAETRRWRQPRPATPSPNRMERFIGAAFIVFGFCLLMAGRYLLKGFRRDANYSGIGGFRLTRGGLAWFIGYLIVICGSSAVFVGLIVLFL